MTLENQKISVGLVGYGAFGKIVAQLLDPHLQLLVYDPEAAEDEKVNRVDFCRLADCSIIVLAVPVPALPEVLSQLKTVVRPTTLVIDTCSVKVHPLQWMAELLPDYCEYLGSHPLFGPQSIAKSGWSGKKIVLCPGRAQQESVARVSNFLKKLELQVIFLDADSHDQNMASVQGLTHFLAWTLKGLDLADLDLGTLAYQHLIELQELLTTDSPGLFLAIQRENPYAAKMRQQLRKRMDELETWIDCEM